MKTAALVEELKKSLKIRAITYAILAKRLDLSEAAIKRLFSEANFSLQRLDEICHVSDIDLGELFRAAERHRDKPEPLALAVEDELASDDDLLLTLYMILLKHPLKRILSELATDRTGYYRLCRRLEKLGLIDVHAGNKVVPRMSKSVRWRADGPLVKRFGLAIRDEFFHSTFERDDEHQDFLTGALSIESYNIIKRRMRELLREFESLSDLDNHGDDHQREVFWLYAGIRPWAPIEVVKRVKDGRE